MNFFFFLHLALASVLNFHLLLNIYSKVSRFSFAAQKKQIETNYFFFIFYWITAAKTQSSKHVSSNLFRFDTEAQKKTNNLSRSKVKNDILSLKTGQLNKRRWRKKTSKRTKRKRQWKINWAMKKMWIKVECKSVREREWKREREREKARVNVFLHFYKGDLIYLKKKKKKSWFILNYLISERVKLSICKHLSSSAINLFIWKKKKLSLKPEVAQSIIFKKNFFISKFNFFFSNWIFKKSKGKKNTNHHV